jgi:hypothetical protein
MNDYEPWSRGEPPHEGQEPPPRDRAPFHPLANHFPLMDPAEAEFKGLVTSIRNFGLQDPIVLYQGMVLDGRNRFAACKLADVKPRFVDFNEAKHGPPLEYVFAKNLHRRHLTVGQRAFLALEMVTTTHGDARRFNKQGNDSSDTAPKSSREPLNSEKVTIAQAASMWSVSPASIKRADNVIQNTKTSPSIVREVKAGTLELGLAHTMANKTPEEQRAHPLVKFARRTPSQRPAARPVTVNAIRELPDEQFLALVVRDLPRLNRAAAREGKRIIIEDLR